MVYDFKVKGLYDVSPQTVGEEFERIIEDSGELTPTAVVDKSRPEDAPLHKVFEWRDDVAAEKWRENQAQKLIHNVTIVCQKQEEEPVQVRAFVHVQKDYKPIQIVLSDDDMRKELLRNAYRELTSFKTKYQTLSELSPLMLAIDTVIGETA